VRIAAASRFVAGILIAIACLVVAAPARAAGDPDLVWWTLETEHFRVTYPHPLETVARRIATLAETIHTRLSTDLAYVPSTRTEIVITDNSDLANGSATSVPYNAIHLFAQAPPDISALGDHDDWYLTLLTHEYVHTLHIDNVSGIPAIVNKVLGKQFTPNSAQPRWIIEGLATVYESAHTSGGRVRSSMFDMFLRADVLADNFARLDQISANSHRWPRGNLFYLYGSRFLRWVMDVYGPDSMTAVSADYGASVIPFGINRAIRRATGRTYEELYVGFEEHLKERYAKQMKEVRARGLREGRRLTHHGELAHYPAFVPASARQRVDREELVYYRDDGNSRPGIYRLPIEPDEDGDLEDAELLARTAGVSAPRFAPNGDLVFQSTAFWKNVYARFDLFRLPRGERSVNGSERARRRLTHGLRAMEPDVSPSGRRIVFTVRGVGTSYLEIADIDHEGEIVGRRDLVSSAEFDQAYTPRFSPNGKYVAYSVWTKGGHRDIRVVEVASGHHLNITRDRAIDMQPAWSRDGRTIFFSSDRTGIFNIYAFDVEKRHLRQVTNVRIGAIAPAVSLDGKRLAYTGYTTIGYDLFLMELDPKRYLPALPPNSDRPDPPSEPAPVKMERKAYNPLYTLRPRSYTVALQEGRYNENALRIEVEGSDIASHHSFSANVTIEPDAPSPRVALNYTYGRLPVNLRLRGFHTVNPRGGLRVGGEEIVFDERTFGLTTGITYPLNLPFSSHSFGLAYSASVFKGEKPFEPSDFDPYASRTLLPPEGIMGTFSVSYSLSTAEGARDVPGTARGTTFRLGLDVADETTGSDYSLRTVSYDLTTFLQMPWPGHHALMLRNAGGVSGGTFPRRGSFFVGGHDIADVSTLDAITQAFETGFILRGYQPGSYVGDEYLLTTAEYRFPILVPDAGLSTLPFFLKRIDGALFVDYGGAFDELQVDEILVLRQNQLIDSPDLHASVGGEVWFGATVAHRVETRVRLGYAYGFSQEAIPGGQVYVLGSGLFE